MNAKKLIAATAENWPAKAISLALAIALYIFHSMSALEERYFSVPLIIEESGNLVLSKSFPRTVRINLKGDANSLYPIIESDIEAYIDLGRYENPGDYRTEILVRKKGSALNAETLEIRVDPADIVVSLDYKISKFVPVTASIRGNVEDGYILNSYTLNPARVVIDGPSEIISGIFELNTDFIDLEGREEDFTATVNILNRDPFIVIRGAESAEFSGHISRIDSGFFESNDEDDDSPETDNAAEENFVEEDFTDGAE